MGIRGKGRLLGKKKFRYGIVEILCPGCGDSLQRVLQRFQYLTNARWTLEFHKVPSSLKGGVLELKFQ